MAVFRSLVDWWAAAQLIEGITQSQQIVARMDDVNKLLYWHKSVRSMRCMLCGTLFWGDMEGIEHAEMEAQLHGLTPEGRRFPWGGAMHLRSPASESLFDPKGELVASTAEGDSLVFLRRGKPALGLSPHPG